MSLYLLDTDIASYIIKGRYPKVNAHFAAANGKVFISSITAAELQYGVAKLGNEQLLQKVQDFCMIVPCLSWGGATIQAYAELRNYLQKNGLCIDTMDMLIAAAALADNLTLVTNNLAHFSRVPKLKLENWAE